MDYIESEIQMLLHKAVFIWDQGRVASTLGVTRETVNRWLKRKGIDELNRNYIEYDLKLKSLFPDKPANYHRRKFHFIDLFAGIGGLRRAFEDIGGKCVFTSEWNEFAKRTYMANFYDDHAIHIDKKFRDIKYITEGNVISEKSGRALTEISEDEIIASIDQLIPNHHVLVAGFPCQPFSIAGVSKKNALGLAHGFDCKIQGTLFFDICKVLQVKKPACFLLENVKNLRSHNGGDTFNTIMEALDDLGYAVANPKVINAQDYVPQHRERIVIVGFRKDLEIGAGLDLDRVKPVKGKAFEKLGDILETADEIAEKYTLTQKLWDYLYNYKIKHRSNGNGFGYDIFTPDSPYTRTLSARYYKDGSEILIAKSKAHKTRCENGHSIPRRLTPRECARLMGFERPDDSRKFIIPVSDTQAYKQFGNSVVVPVFEAVARQMKPHIMGAVELEEHRFIQQDKTPQLELPLVA